MNATVDQLAHLNEHELSKIATSEDFMHSRGRKKRCRLMLTITVPVSSLDQTLEDMILRTLLKNIDSKQQYSLKTWRKS